MCAMYLLIQVTKNHFIPDEMNKKIHELQYVGV